MPRDHHEWADGADVHLHWCRRCQVDGVWEGTPIDLDRLPETDRPDAGHGRRNPWAARASLRAAVERIAARYARLPGWARPDVNDGAWTAVERELELALAAGREEPAMLAVARWERHAHGALDRAASAAGEVDARG